MKLLLSSRGLFLLGFLLLVATNIVVLAGVASNRSGEPESYVTLTERELRLPYQVYEENSGLALDLTWRALIEAEDYGDYTSWRTPVWLNAEKLEALGFNTEVIPDSNDNDMDYDPALPKEVFIVLENNSALYRDVVKWAEKRAEEKTGIYKLNPADKERLREYEQSKEQLTREQISESRLFAIDAGLDPVILRNTYADKNRFIITKGLIRAEYNGCENKAYGYITELTVEDIHVPIKHRQVFDSIIEQDKTNENENDTHPPRFEVTLAYGNRFEPWIVSVKALDDTAN
jgi:hypothetical protein